jgi:hypothetical protein
MSNSTHNPQRRRVLAAAVGAVATVPLINLLASRGARAEDLPHLTEDDPAAKALQYHEDASAAPRADKPGAKADEQFCHNCRFIQAESGDYRPCQLFPGKAVAADGWCVSWAAK